MVEPAAPIPAKVLRHELGEQTLITRFKDLEVHLFKGPDAPETLNEIGRIREYEYRKVGAGRNLPRDLDLLDTQEPMYRQIVSFDREQGELVAMYRAQHCGYALRQGGVSALRTAGLFRFSNTFRENELPYLIELGRSVVNSRARRAIQGLFSVWSGLAALHRELPELQGFFGNVSVYGDVSDKQLGTLLSYLYAHHRDTAGRVWARPETAWRPAEENSAAGAPENLDGLIETAAAEGWSVPPILVSYLKASPKLVAFDTAIDRDFGGAREIAILVPSDGFTEKTRKRFIDPYCSVNPAAVRW